MTLFFYISQHNSGGGGQENKDHKTVLIKLSSELEFCIRGRSDSGLEKSFNINLLLHLYNTKRFSSVPAGQSELGNVTSFTLTVHVAWLSHSSRTMAVASTAPQVGVGVAVSPVHDSGLPYFASAILISSLDAHVIVKFVP